MSVADQKAKQEQGSRNVRLLFLAVVLAGAMLLIRLWYLQILRGEYFNRLAQNNHIRTRRIRSLRGIIFDRHRKILADNHLGFNLSIIPENISDIEGLATALARYLPDVDPAVIVKNFRKVPSYLQYRPLKVKNNLTRNELALLEAHKPDLPGILIETEAVRHYPFDVECSHIIGYLGYINERELQQPAYEAYYPDDLVGRSGIEARYEDLLRGTDGKRQVEVNALGRELNSHVLRKAVPGDNLVLTIDIDLQSCLYDLLKDKVGSAVAVDPRTGDILAMVSTPSFSNNMFATRISRSDWQAINSDPLKPLQNRAIQGQYPPGSTFKVIMAAAALEDQVVTPATKFFCSGVYRLGNAKFRCWNKYGHGEVNLSRSLKESCDVYYYNLGSQMSIDRIAHYCSLFGLGRKTGISLSQEKPGFIPTSSWKLQRFHDQWYRGETLSVAIGQGFVLTTPLQMALAYVPVANGGSYFRPRLVKTIENRDGRQLREIKPEGRRLPIKNRHLELIRQGLWRVVNERHGTAYKMRISDTGWEMAGKTGTAQVINQPGPRPKKGEEIPWKYRDHGWFVAFAPFRDPRIVVSVLVEHGGHGGSAAAPIAREAIMYYLQNQEQ